MWNGGGGRGVQGDWPTGYRMAIKQRWGLMGWGDTALSDHSIFGGFVARGHGVRWYGCNRPRAVPDNARSRNAKRKRKQSRIYGGVGFLVFDRSLIVRKIFEDKKGIIAVHVQKRGSPALPFAAVYVYNPPSSSPLNSGSSKWSDDIMQTLDRLTNQLCREYSVVIEGGDLNMRAREYSYTVANADGKPEKYTRSTSDTDYNPGGAARTSTLRKFMRATSMCPVFGDRGQLPGYGTSRAVYNDLPREGTGAESDTILYKVGTSPDVVRALPCVYTWAELPVALTHLPVAVEVTMQMPPSKHAACAACTTAGTPSACTHAATGAAVAENAAGGDAGGDGVGHAVRQVESAVYKDEQGWDAMASRLDGICSSMRQEQAAGADIDTVYEHFIDNVRLAAKETLSEDRVPPAVADGAAAAAVGNGERGRKRKQLRDFRHLGKLPAEQLKLVATVHRLRKRLFAGDLDADERAELRRERKSASRALRKWARQKVAEGVQAAEKIISSDRIFNPSRMWRELQRISPIDPDCFSSTESIPDKAGHPAARVRFYRHQRKLAKETRGSSPCPGVSLFNACLARESTAGAGAATLARPITAWEAYVVLFPMHPDLLAACPAGCVHGCGAACKLWRDFVPRLQAGSWDDPDHPLPDWKPSVSTATAAGCDGLRVETLRFARPHSEAERVQYRLRLCAALAELFNTWLDAKRVPTTQDFRRQVVTPVSKDGTNSDPSDPDLYRGISVGNLIPKVFSLVLLSRLSHWAVNNDLVGPEQVGFMPMHSADMHVLTMRELLQMRHNAKQDTYALFLPSLWHILTHAGVPPDLVQLLREWDTSRKAAVRVNSELSEDFPTDKGVPQGEVLSPLFFNIFIESLSRHIKSLPGFAGVTVRPRSALAAAAVAAAGGPSSFHVSHLLYADDLVILAESPEQLQLALSAVDRWCASFYLEMGTSQGKTEAMAFRHDRAPLPNKATKAQIAAARAADVSGLPVLKTANGRVVAWTPEYKYLGFPLRCDLSVTAHIDRYKGKLESLYGRYFKFNRAVQRLPTTLQSQISTTMLSGAVSYLMAVLPLNETEMLQLDKVMRNVIRTTLRCPASAPTSIVEAERRTLPFYSLVVKHHLRLYYYLQHTPFQDSIAARLVRFLENGMPPVSRGGCVNWVTWTLRCLDDETEDKGPALNGTHRLPNAPRPVVHSLVDIPKQVTLLARAMAFSRWQRTRTIGLNNESANVAHGGVRYVTSSTMPRPGPPLAHVSDLLGGSIFAHWSCLGTAAFATPMSRVGPGCTSLFNVCTLPSRCCNSIMRLRTGQQAFTLYPFHAYNPEPNGGDGDSDDDGAAAAAAAGVAPDRDAVLAARKATRNAAWRSRKREEYRAKPCPHCAPPPGAPVPALTPAMTECPWHLLFLCREPRVAALQQDMQRDAASFLSKLLPQLSTVSSTCYKLCDTVTVQTEVQRLTAAYLQPATAPALAAYWQTPSGHFLLNRLLTVLPFPVEAVTDPIADSPATCLGRIFGAITAPNRGLRKVANLWVAWANRWIYKFATLRRELLGVDADDDDSDSEPDAPAAAAAAAVAVAPAGAAAGNN